MKTDLSRWSFDELEHSLGVFLQMGRVQLDSDWNEQTETSLRLLQRNANDTIHIGSPNRGFRVDDRSLLDAMDSRAHWSAASADPGFKLFVDYFTQVSGEGSLAVQGVATLARKLDTPLDVSEWTEIVFAATGAFADGAVSFYVAKSGTRGALTTVKDSGVVLNGWRIYRAQPSSATPAVDLTAIDEFGFINLDKTQRYNFGFIKADRPVRWPLISPVSASAFTTTTQHPNDTPQISIDLTDRFWGGASLQVSNVISATYTFPITEDLSHIRALRVAAKTSAGAPNETVTITDATAGAAHVDLSAPAISHQGGWEIRAYSIPQGAIDWTQVKSLQFGGLTPATTYTFAPVVAEMSPAGNLVIMGGDGHPEDAGRFYGDGLAAILESDETYFSQHDLPQADPSALVAPAANKHRVDLAFLHMWERPITYIQRPEIREIALEGPDTCTRVQLVAQVRLLKGGEVDLGATATPPTDVFNQLLRHGNGTLTTKNNLAVVSSACADPCEPAITGAFLGEDNHLNRVEIHQFGQIGAANAATTAIFKWSQENAAVATALVADAAAGNFSVTVEKPELFSIGDLIEISDDLIELVTGPYEDRANHRNHQRGELRKISSVDLDTKVVSWQAPGSPEPDFHKPLANNHRVFLHASIRRWDNVAPVTSGDLPLTDGVAIQFGGTDLYPGDFWTFTTRAVDGSIERLLDAPPQGIRNRYYKLAAIERAMDNAGHQTVAITDLRPKFHALTALRAAEMSFDTGEVGETADWSAVQNVQQAIETLWNLNSLGSIEDHNKYLHGYGVVCGLQVNCNSADRGTVVVQTGYALECSGSPLRVNSPITYDVVTEAQNAKALDAGGNGSVALWIERGAPSAVVKLEPNTPSTFWKSVLEGTLILDFYNDSIGHLVDLFKKNFLPIPATAVPVPHSQKLLVSFINLLFSLVNPVTAPYVFLGTEEDSLLGDDPRTADDVTTGGFYYNLRDALASHTFCAMFDGVTPYPAYPYPKPPGIETAFSLFHFHRRMRLHPGNQYLYTCGYGSKIDVFDLTNHALVVSLDFPGGANVEVQDVAFSPDGTQLNAVATLNGQDSVFASATIAANAQHTWGPVSIVCNILFLRLARVAGVRAANLYAIGRAQGLYIIDPNNVPLVPTPTTHFNATGLLEVSPDGNTALAGQSNSAIGTVDASFEKVCQINLAAPPNAPTVFYNCSGVDAANDIAFAGNNVFITGEAGGNKDLYQFPIAGGAPSATVPLPANTPASLTPVPDHKLLFVTLMDLHKAVRVDISGAAPVIDTHFRVPTQLFPINIGANPVRGEVYMLNMLSCTVSVGTIATILNNPAYTAEPPTTLSTYHSQAIQAYKDLLSKFWQYLKDAFCDQFLINCPTCGDKDKIYLGVVTIQGNKVYKICNFDKRKYVKSVKNWEYWLSAVPILPLLKKLFADFCCKVF